MFRILRFLYNIQFIQTLCEFKQVLAGCMYHKFPAEISVEWNIKNLLNFKEEYSLIILNTPIVDTDAFIPLWKAASFKIAVDGGANHLFKLLHQNKQDKKFSLPNILSGDFDSIDPNILQYYKNKGVQIIHTPDKINTDFWKALEFLPEKHQNNVVLVYCDNIGRLDQIMANLNTLYKVSHDSRMKHFKILLIGENSLTWLLKKGKHLIFIPEYLWTEKSSCGLIPLGNSCQTRTSGLKWNLNNHTLEFGGLVSSSNTYDIHLKNPLVQVTTKNAILWTMTINSKLRNK